MQPVKKINLVDEIVFLIDYSSSFKDLTKIKTIEEPW